MADALLDEQAAPAAPSAGQGLVWPDNASGGLMYRNSTRPSPITGTLASATAAQLLGVGDTVVTGSRVIVPSTGLWVGAVYHVRLSLSKSGAGTAQPIWTVRLGINGTTADAPQWTHTGVLQTAIAETGYYELICTLRTIGATGVLQGSLTVVRTGGAAATGLASVPVVEVSGAAADKSWVTAQGILLSVNAGASSAWTVTQCVAELK